MSALILSSFPTLEWEKTTELKWSYDRVNLYLCNFVLLLGMEAYFVFRCGYIMLKLMQLV
jgi:hypothetical protein